MYSKSLQILLIGLLLITNVLAQEKTREVVAWNSDWRFHLGDEPNAHEMNHNDNTWRSLNLPHDWSIEGKFDEQNPSGVGGGALPGGIGWYRKSFALPQSSSGKKIFIAFDGVYRNGEVWINDHYLGKRPNGYISFQYDITPYVHAGNEKNIIAVKVDNSQQPNSRWYSGSGIYRNVWLITTNKIHVDQWGTFVQTPQVSTTSASVSFATRLVNETDAATAVTLVSHILDPSHQEAGKANTTVSVGKGARESVQQNITIKNPSLWTLEHPNRYTLVTDVMVNGKRVDQYETSFGIRSFEFDVERGFSLNGKHTKINGVCLHHDLGCLGSAFHMRAMERQIEIMKGMGVNAIRTSHNPPAPELLDLCDKMGIIVMDEAFDMWKKEKTKYDYHLDWDEWHKRDLEDFVTRDRNHPSVMIWSVGNEIPEQWDSTGVRITRELAEIVRALDTTRPITTANNEVTPINNLIKSGALDLIGFNYHQESFESFPNVYPGKKFIATETVSSLATRGHYDMPSDSVRRWPIAWDKPFTQGNADHTVSAYDNVSAPWGSTQEETWKILKRHDFLSGGFIWTGFDYIGEPTPYGWPSRSSYFGVVDLAGFPKDTYYLYQSEWTDKTTLHIFPHWNWAPGKLVDVWAYYNQADEVELFLNGKSLGTKHKQGEDLHVMWRIPFEPGTLRAVSRKNGKEVLTKEIKTAGTPAKIVLEADHQQIHAKGDLSFVTVRVLDAAGNVVPDADNLIHFTVTGNGSIAAVDNGNPVSMESFQAHQRKAFHGLALVVLKSSAAGKIMLKASSDGLTEASVEISVK